MPIYAKVLLLSLFRDSPTYFFPPACLINPASLDNGASGSNKLQPNMSLAARPPPPPPPPQCPSCRFQRIPFHLSPKDTSYVQIFFGATPSKPPFRVPDLPPVAAPSASLAIRCYSALRKQPFVWLRDISYLFYPLPFQWAQIRRLRAYSSRAELVQIPFPPTPPTLNAGITDPIDCATSPLQQLTSLWWLLFTNERL